MLGRPCVTTTIDLNMSSTNKTFTKRTTRSVPQAAAKGRALITNPGGKLVAPGEDLALITVTMNERGDLSRTGIPVGEKLCGRHRRYQGQEGYYLQSILKKLGIKSFSQAYMKFSAMISVIREGPSFREMLAFPSLLKNTL